MTAPSDARAFLFIFFSIIVFGANILLILLIVCTRRLTAKPELVTLLSLAIGDIFLSLFMFVLQAGLNIEPDKMENLCGLLFSSVVYGYNFVPFLYSVGLIVLSLQLCMKNRSDFKIMLSVFLSAVPWLLGVAIVVPLTTLGYDWKLCLLDESFTRLRFLAILAVSQYVPAIAAFITGICVVVWKQPEPYLDSDNLYTKPLMWSTIVNVIIVVQLSAFLSNISIGQPGVKEILTEIATWVSFSRSFITPVIWIIPRVKNSVSEFFGTSSSVLSAPSNA